MSMSPQGSGAGQGMGYESRVSPREIMNANVQRHIDAGEITQRDFDLLKASYQRISNATLLCSALGGGLTFFLIKRRFPRMPIGRQIMGGATGGVVGTFIGYVVGGVGASLELRNKMEDAPRKMKIFAGIANEVRDEVVSQQRLPSLNSTPPPPSSIPYPRDANGRPIGVNQPTSTGSTRYPGSSSGTGAGSSSSPWDSDSSAGVTLSDMDDSTSDMRQELDRQKNYKSELEDIKRDSEMAKMLPSDRFDNQESRTYDSVTQPENYSRQGQGRGAQPGNASGGTGAWDRIRSAQGTDNIPRAGARMPGYNAGSSGNMMGGGMGRSPGEGGGAVDERSKEQRDFDAMLEKERSGVDEKDMWR